MGYGAEFRATVLRTIDEDGMWVCGYNEDGDEVELIIRGITPEILKIHNQTDHDVKTGLVL